ncbi:MAG: DUF5666 domain-containing protein [Patescibacteria group bacterium]|nr:DUF5666 domain-containing protein [Patescibacteria group bacterium]
MDKKIISISLVTLVVAGSLGFYGGMKYAQSKGPANNSQNAFQQMRGNGQNGTAAGTRRFGNGQSGGFLSGDVLSKDDKSVTLKLRDGSTRIVFYSTTTSIGKAVAGSAGDLAAGQQVTVAGTANADGSVTAQQIQIRPEQAPVPGGPQGN